MLRTLGKSKFIFLSFHNFCAAKLLKIFDICKFMCKKVFPLCRFYKNGTAFFLLYLLI